MKARVNLTIETDLLTRAKKYAEEKGSSVSELVEEYFKKITKPKKQRSKLLEMVKKLKPVEYPANFDYKEEYYKAKTEKHGF